MRKLCSLVRVSATGFLLCQGRAYAAPVSGEQQVPAAQPPVGGAFAKEPLVVYFGQDRVAERVGESSTPQDTPVSLGLESCTHLRDHFRQTYQNKVQQQKFRIKTYKKKIQVYVVALNGSAAVRNEKRIQKKLHTWMMVFLIPVLIIAVHRVWIRLCRH